MPPVILINAVAWLVQGVDAQLKRTVSLSFYSVGLSYHTEVHTLHEANVTYAIDRYYTVNARPFDPNWITSAPSLMKYLGNLCDELTKAEKRERRREQAVQAHYEAAIKAIVLDLYRAHLSDPSLEVGIGMRRETLQRRSSWQYGSTIYTPTQFEQAMKALLQSGFIEKTTNFWFDRISGRSRTSRYKATLTLLVGLNKAGGAFTSLSRHKGAESIRLKDTDKKLVEYGDNHFANGARDRLSIINGMLESHWADLALTDQQLSDELTKMIGERNEETAQSFDFSARTVYRVFNNNGWEQGGRFYGAWWMACPSRLRRHILIDGKQTVEVDYSGLHPAMLFAEARLPIPDDPYERCMTTVENKAERRLIKQTFNALLNARSVAGLNEIEGYFADLTGRDWKAFKLFIVNKYPEFSQHFGSGVGLRLQRKDSDLAETVMLEFAQKGYACLPVHDSFLVHHKLQNDLIDSMKEAFEAEFGAVSKVAFEVGLEEPVENIGEPIGLDVEALLHPTGYEARLQAFRATQEESELIVPSLRV